MSDTGFEERLTQLVFPQVRSKLPRLLPMMVGFELLDVNEDETEASGIYAFRIGDQMVYVPIFFKDGHVKGLNLLYLENDDLFLPAEDEWVDYIVNRQPFSLGKLVGREELQGNTVSTFDNVAAAFGKTAARTQFGTQGMAINLSMGKRHLASAAKCDLGSLLLRFPKSATLAVLNTMQESDDFGRAVLKFYDFDKLAEIADKVVKEKKIKEPSADPESGAGVKYDRKPMALTSDDDNGLGGSELSTGEREDIQLEGVSFRDSRDETDVTKVYKTSAPVEWFGPKSGIFKILDIKGKQRKAVVFEDIITVGEGIAKCKVIVTDDGVGGTIARDSLTATEELSDEEWSRWFSKLPKINSASLGTEDKFVLVNSKMQTTPMLRVIGPKSTSPEGITTLFVRQDEYVKRPRRRRDEYGYPGRQVAAVPFGGLADDDDIWMEHDEERTPILERYVQKEVDKGERKLDEVEDYDYRNGRRITVLGTSDTDDMLPSGNQLMAGTDVRVMKVDDKADELMSPCDISLWPHLKQAAGVKQLRVYTDGNEFEIKCGAMSSGMVARPRALIHLVCGHGTNAKAAREILKETLAAHATTPRGGMTFAIKHAASFPELDIQTSSTGDQQGISESEQRTQMDEGAGNPFLTNDIRNTMQAARTGQKSLFDSSVLTSLLRRHDTSSAIDEMLGDVTIGLDRVCRILFLLYAHRDAFEEQFGQEDVPELEDSLENLAKEMGDTLLFLKKKSIETEAGITEPEGLLSPVA